MISCWERWTPAGQRFISELKKIQGQEVFIGFQAGTIKHKDENGNEGTIDMLDVVAWNEFGTANSPPRPFLRQTVDENQDKISRFTALQSARLADGVGAENILEQLGLFGKKLVQKQIRDGTFAPNAPSTIRAKKSSKPLIDTGQMRQSVQYIIRAKGGK